MENNKLKRIRKILNLSQKETAAKLGVPFTTISRYEHNIIKPSFDILSRYAKIFNVNINWLLTGRGEMFISEKAGAHSNGTGIDEAEYRERIRELEREIADLKKSIHLLETENKELNSELLQRFRELVNLQQKLASQS